MAGHTPRREIKHKRNTLVAGAAKSCRLSRGTISFCARARYSGQVGEDSGGDRRFHELPAAPDG
jgi:hypothetical protein